MSDQNDYQKIIDLAAEELARLILSQINYKKNKHEKEKKLHEGE